MSGWCPPVTVTVSLHQLIAEAWALSDIVCLMAHSNKSLVVELACRLRKNEIATINCSGFVPVTKQQLWCYLC